MSGFCVSCVGTSQFADTGSGRGCCCQIAASHAHNTAQPCTKLHHTAQNCKTLHKTAQQCTTMYSQHCTTTSSTTLHNKIEHFISVTQLIEACSYKASIVILKSGKNMGLTGDTPDVILIVTEMNQKYVKTISWPMVHWIYRNGR